ncbi:MAG TPA: hypothetical protein VH877_31980 [Polyangia bacterium]|jgi:hypothetical protein|nr:hypothetical protein [Polyangia bacterium]
MRPQTKPTKSTRTRKPQPAPRRTLATAPPLAAGAQRRYTLDDLAQAPAPNPQLRIHLFLNTKEEDLVAMGQRIDSIHILRAVPDFYGAVREIMARLTPNQRRLVVGFSDGLLGLLASETMTLAGYKKEFDLREQGGATSRAQAREARREAMSEGVALRDQAYTRLADVLGGGDEVAALRANKGTAETAADLALGLGQIAGQIEGLHAKDPAFSETLTELGLGLDYAQQLHATATRVRDTEKAATATTPDVRVTQRTLDLQDGIVLRVVDVIYGAFRSAQDRDASILLPNLGAMRSLIARTRPAARRADTPTTPSPTPPKAPPRADGGGTPKPSTDGGVPPSPPTKTASPTRRKARSRG